MLTTVVERTVKGVEELVNEFAEEGIAAGYLACLIAILYFGSVYGLEKLGSSTTWNSTVRGFIADYAYVVSLPSPPQFASLGERRRTLLC